MIGDNGPALDGWQLPPRCCGQWSNGLSCDICGQWLKIPDSIQLGEN